MALTPTSVIKRNTALLSTRVDDDIFILNPVRDNYIGLDSVGRRVWELIEAPVSIDNLCQQVTQEYQGDGVQIPLDLMAFLEELDSEGLLEGQ